MKIHGIYFPSNETLKALARSKSPDHMLSELEKNTEQSLWLKFVPRIRSASQYHL